MRRLRYGLAAVLACAVWLPTVQAQSGFFSSAAIREFQQALTDASRFGVPRYATASLPTCSTANTGALAYDTTLTAITVCNGSAWGPAGTSSGTANTWTADQTFNDDVDLILGTGADANIVYNTTQTPDALFIGVGQDSRGLIVAEKADAAFDFAHAQQTNPTLFVHSAAQNTTQYVGLTHNGTNGAISVGAGLLTISAAGGTFVAVPNVTLGVTSTGASVAMGMDTTGTGGVSTLQFGINGARKVSFGFLDDTSLGAKAFFLYNGALSDYVFMLQDNARVAVMGNCITCAAPLTTEVRGASGLGTNIAGADMTLAGGRGTGTGAGGNLNLQTSPALASGSTGQTLETRQIVVAKQKTLTDNTIATFAVQTLGNDTGGGGTIHYCVYAADATTAGLECGSADFAGVDVTAGAGGEVCTNLGKIGTPLQALSGSTLTVTLAASTGTDLCNLRVTADTDIATPVELWIKYTVVNSGRTITPQ